MEFINKITDEEIKQLPKLSFEGDIFVIEDFKQQNDAAEFLMQYEVIGFDTESRASFQKGIENKISLVQLSAAGKAFLIRVNRVKLSQGIIKLLQSPNHIKVGVALRDDIRELQGVTDFEPKGFLDLQRIVADFGISELSLKKVSAIVLGIYVSKAQRLSNWEATTLTESQIIYAATDAWLCEEIYKNLDITPELLKKGEPGVKDKKKDAQKHNEDSLKRRAERAARRKAALQQKYNIENNSEEQKINE